MRVKIRAAKSWRQFGECRISTYSTGSHGYAQIGWQESGARHVVLAHRAAWEYVHERVPVGMTLDHTCKNRRCVNPEHLRVISNFENARRTNGKDWPLGECENGHPNSFLKRYGRGRQARVKCSECQKPYAALYRWTP
jgi:hypothetical protein